MSDPSPDHSSDASTVIPDVPRDARWSPQRKAALVNAVRSGAITFAEAAQRYRLSAEEFSAWEQTIEHHGLQALRVTRLQHYRRRASGRL